MSGGKKPRFKLRRGGVDAALEHGVEEFGEAVRVAKFGGGVVGDGLVGEKQALHRACARLKNGRGRAVGGR